MRGLTPLFLYSPFLKIYLPENYDLETSQEKAISSLSKQSLNPHCSKGIVTMEEKRSI